MGDIAIIVSSDKLSSADVDDMLNTVSGQGIDAADWGTVLPYIERVLKHVGFDCSVTVSDDNAGSDANTYVGGIDSLSPDGVMQILVDPTPFNLADVREEFGIIAGQGSLVVGPELIAKVRNFLYKIGTRYPAGVQVSETGSGDGWSCNVGAAVP